ncbi:MAG: DUF333 domain-containing protein [Thermoflexales bacterium]|nr:DUF333 domain-containing protein [Thermoflexales bacterium]
MKVLISVFILALLMAACSSTPAPLPTAAAPNPASANCVAKGGTLDIRRETNGEVGYCKFADGSECEEWAYFRNECQPKTPNVPPTAVAGLPNPASANCIKQGGDLIIRTDAKGEVGYCQFPDGSECEEWALYRNECQPKSAATITSTTGVTVMVPLVSGDAPTPQSEVTGLANPASTNCVNKGGTLEIRQDASGGQVGYCQFPDGSQCEEWALLRGECQPGNSAATSVPQPMVLTQPRRIVFADGGTSALEQGSAGPGQTFPYVIYALAGQTMSVNLTPLPGGKALLIIWGADGTVLISDHAEATTWSGVLLSSQDYFIDVRSAPGVWTDFWLDVVIPPLQPAESSITPIVFQPGTSNANVQGALAANGVARYSLRALVGQVLIANLTMTQGSAIVQVLGADGVVLQPVTLGTTVWSSKLPSTQDYIIEVRSVTNITTNYQLEVSVPPL